MVTINDDFDVLDPAVWSKVVTGDSDVQSTNSLVFARAGASDPGDGNYIYPVEEYSISAVTTGAITIVTTSTPHGYETGEAFHVTIADNGTTGPAINGSYDALATNTTSFTFLLDTTTSTPVNNGVARVCKKLTGANQKTEISAFSTDETALNYVVLWNRFHRSAGGPANLRGGYGFQVLWDAGGVRKASILKIDTTSSTIRTVKQISGVELIDPGDDLQRIQDLKFIVFDDPTSTVGGEATQIYCRGYINESDDGAPTIEFIDRGTEEGNPIQRDPGTWAITFGADSDIIVDSFEGMDEYVVPAFGITAGQHRTRSALRDALYALISRADNNDIDDDRANQALEYGITQVHEDLGDSALWRIKVRNATLDADSDGFITLPWDVDRILGVYDSTGQYRLNWQEITHDGDGDIRTIILGSSTSSDYSIRYVERWDQMDADTDLCPVPRRHDELVILAAGIRMARHEHDAAFEQSLRADYDAALARKRKELRQRRSRQKPVMSIGRRRSNNWAWNRSWGI